MSRRRDVSSEIGIANVHPKRTLEDERHGWKMKKKLVVVAIALMAVLLISRYCPRTKRTEKSVRLKDVIILVESADSNSSGNIAIENPNSEN